MSNKMCYNVSKAGGHVIKKALFALLFSVIAMQAWAVPINVPLPGVISPVDLDPTDGYQSSVYVADITPNPPTAPSINIFKTTTTPPPGSFTMSRISSISQSMLGESPAEWR